MLDIKLTLANILTKLKSHDTSLSTLDTARGGIGMKHIAVSPFPIAAGSPSSPVTKTVDLQTYGINTTIWGVIAYLNSYQLPYFDNTNSTRTSVTSISGQTITITNTAGAWGDNYSLYLLVFYTVS